MSNYTLTLKHKETGEIHTINVIDNYFESRVYGYRLPNGRIIHGDNLEEIYELNEEI